MKIGIYFSAMGRELGGGARFEKEVTQALAMQATDCLEFYLVSHEQNTHFHLPNITVPYPSSTSLKRLAAERLRLVKPRGPYATRLTRKLKANGIDLLYSPHPRSLVEDIPFVVTCWDLQHRMQPFFPEVSTMGHLWNDRESLYRKVFPRATAIVTGTKQGKNEVDRFYGVAPDRIHVIPFFVPDSLLHCSASTPGWMPNNRFIVYPAQFWPHKNHATIILALRHLKTEHGIGVTAVFPGSPTKDAACTRAYVEQLARQHGVLACFPGFVSDEELRGLYEHADALVFASLFGPDNLPPLEAMSVRCPVVASRVPGSEEQLGDAALLVSPTDEIAMANAICQLIGKPDVRHRLIEKGQQLTDNLSVQGYAQSLVSLFEQFRKYRRCWPADDEH